MPTAHTAQGIHISYDRIDPRGGPAPDAGVLLLLNHLSTNRLMWEPVLKEGRSRGLTVLAVDARGCGKSDTPAGRWRTSDLADDAVGVLDHANVDKAHVCGISLGGCVAQEVVLRHPGRIRSLILMATTSNGLAPGAMSERELARITLAQLRTGAPRERAARRLLGALTSPAFAEMAHETPAWPLVHTVLDEPTPRLGTLKQLGAGTTHNTGKRLGSIRAPTLVVHGSADRLFPVQAGQRLAARIPSARFQALEGLGHGLIFQAPGLCAQRILEFAEEHAAGRAPHATAVN